VAIGRIELLVISFNGHPRCLLSCNCDKPCLKVTTVCGEEVSSAKRKRVCSKSLDRNSASVPDVRGFPQSIQEY
jgi:hypothetical protein